MQLNIGMSKHSAVSACEMCKCMLLKASGNERLSCGIQQETDLSFGSDVQSLRTAFVEVHEELEVKFPDYEAHSKDHSSMAQVIVALRPHMLYGCWEQSATISEITV